MDEKQRHNLKRDWTVTRQTHCSGICGPPTFVSSGVGSPVMANATGPGYQAARGGAVVTLGCTQIMLDTALLAAAACMAAHGKWGLRRAYQPCSLAAASRGRERHTFNADADVCALCGVGCMPGPAQTRRSGTGNEKHATRMPSAKTYKTTASTMPPPPNTATTTRYNNSSSLDDDVDMR